MESAKKYDKETWHCSNRFLTCLKHQSRDLKFEELVKLGRIMTEEINNRSNTSKEEVA